MELVLGFVLGLAIAAVYFGALWITVQRVPHAAHPGALVLGSYLMRLSAAAGGFYGVLRLGGPAALVAALISFVVVRHLAVYRITRPPQPSGPEGETWS